MDHQLKPGRHGAWQLANARGEPAALRPVPPMHVLGLVNIPLLIPCNMQGECSQESNFTRLAFQQTQHQK